VGKTALNPNEIVAEVFVPELPPHSYGAFGKLSKTAEDIAKVNAAVMVTFDGDTCENVRIALGF
jgi:xanthine dehydrogenase iron-sulfur cluster and FAD-binding subunit A